MTYRIRTERRPTTNGVDGLFYLLESGDGHTGAEVWPAHGFNCVRWFTARDGRTTDWLYAAPDLLADPRPTRSGFPILFPFPNRIRAGRFSWDGHDYRLPVNDPAGANAIHGFACRHPWRVLGQDTTADAAWVTGEFVAARDAPETLALWPADYRLRVTYRLTADRLRVEARVGNLGHTTLPFGLGYHPYFALPAGPDTLVQAVAREAWELRATLPTGRRGTVEARADLRRPRPYADLTLDDLLTGVDGPLESGCGLRYLGRVADGADRSRLELYATREFRDLVVFTPPHRQAVCLEPYTCPTDAVNLERDGVDAGWLRLAPGEEWSADVELRVSG